MGCVRHGLCATSHLRFLVHSGCEERVIASSSVVETSSEHRFFGIHTFPENMSGVCNCNACFLRLCENTLLPQRLPSLQMLVFCAAGGNSKCRNNAKEVSPGMPCIGLPEIARLLLASCARPL